MARKIKKKVAKKKVVSEPRKTRSRPVVALLLFTLAALIAVSVFDYNIEQYNSTDSLDPNLVGYFGSAVGFYSFHFLGVAAFLVPMFVFWFGVRLLIQQERGKRLLTAIASPFAIILAAGLIEWMHPVPDAKGSLFEAQISHNFGGVLGEFLYQSLLYPFIGNFGAFLLLLMGFIIASILVFTDNLGRFFDYLQDTYRAFLANRAESKEMRLARKAERTKAKRAAKEEALLAKAEAKAERAARKKEKAEKPAKSAKSQIEQEDDDDEEEVFDDGRKPSLLRRAPTPLTPAGANAAKAPAPKKKFTPQAAAPEPEPLPEVKKPSLDAATIKIISGEKTEKSVASIPERRGDYIFPPRHLLAEAPDASAIAAEDHAATMQALVRTLEEFSVKVIPGEIHTGPVITR